MEIIIMAIIAGVISLLNKQKKEAPAEKPPVQKPTVSKPRNLKETFDKHAKQLAEEYDKQRKTFEESQRPKRETREQSQLKKQADPVVSQEIAVDRKVKPTVPTDPIKESDITITKELKPSDVVNGIIFAEVLGPPRAKRKHRH
ncbi:hypothetical protein [Jeotgalibacillus haloalkalitolerans]|uniref:Uncharacterized protein n=1 Tax=Jeotgalibacillus haloalkalitolerans TaxID=3104292 RepID=A0ABU5KMP1_9BACL|nr:hypothetical protein [Jeotgalibacillus sp. HH7-29]MDZ5712211.1 hypothetical protein [Jeotgalibacillus sp. HH7-29]